MNETIKTIWNHRSIRSFQEKELTDSQIQCIVKSAQAASTSSFVQAYTIIGIKDPNKKKELAKIAGDQEYIAKNGHFFVFCLDLHRMILAAKVEGMKEDNITESLASTELYTVGVVDTALAAQNASIAAESMGLGICYIGGLRNDLNHVSTLLQTPDYVIPLFGLCIGYVDFLTDKKPRLPINAVYHEEKYHSDQEIQVELDNYNQQISAYYKQRSSGKREDRWTQMMAKQLTNPKRLYLKSYLWDKKITLR